MRTKTVLKDLASVIRSKNAGPYEITFDIILDDDASFQRVQSSNRLTTDTIAQLFNVEVQDIVELVFFKQARAVKITMKRTVPSGSPGERDTYGAQQHVPLLNLSIP